jgi:hypothetical protein
VLGRRPAPGRAETPQFGRLAWIAVSKDELALVRLKSRNGVTLSPSEAIARIPLSELRTVELGRGYVAPLTMSFGNGDTGGWISLR